MVIANHILVFFINSKFLFHFILFKIFFQLENLLVFFLNNTLKLEQFIRQIGFNKILKLGLHNMKLILIPDYLSLKVFIKNIHMVHDFLNKKVT